MRWAAPLALVAALCLATPAERAGAQAAPGAPTGISLLAGAGSFTVSWSAPAVDGGSAITSYDLRHIETAATDKADENWTVVDSDWTSGDLSDTLAGLRDSTGYDVQVRAANALAGSWSDTSAGTTSDHGDTVSAATAITIGSEVPGRIHAAGDTDHFTFTLDGATYVLLEASTGAGTLSLTPTLYDDHGAEVYLYYLNESGWSVIDDGGLSMYALERLEAGTYTIRIAAAAAGQSGSYLLKPQIAAGQVTDEETCEGYSTTQSDPLYGCQWHLKNTQQYGAGGGGFDINVEQAWATTKGEGINVLVVDSGLDYLHSDLRGYEYESGDPNDDSLGHHDPQGSVRHPTAKHGTWVAGVIAARDNDIGTRGVAPRATVYGYTISRGGTQIFNEARARRAAAASHMADVTAVSSNSWRIAHRGTYAAATDEWRNAIESGITSGYGGKGVLYVWLAGNFHANGSYANRDEMLVHHGVTVVCAVNYNDVRTTYSERGDNLWLCAPSGDPDRMLPGIATTALHNEYNLSFGGTSAATPIVSGVAALVRAANTALTWRDVKLILAGSARRNDASNTGWEQGALAYGSTTDRYWFNTEYGFGVVDAGAAVELATGWTNLPPFRERSASASPELAIPDRPEGGTAEAASSTVTLGPEVEFVEYASVELRFSHGHRDDIQVDLTSPAGTVSELFPAFESPNHSPGFRRSVTDLTFHLGASKHLGESAEGTWTLRVSDTANGLTGTLHSWTLTVRGHGQKPLVSNAVQGEDHSSTNRIDRSQTFTTSVGATLSSVEIISEDPEGDDATVSLCTVDGSNHPTSICTVLTAPPSFAAGTLVFRAPANTTLAANTTYSLLIASPDNDWLLLDATDSDNEDAGGATGWSIANTFDTETSSDTWVVSDWALRITIKGTINNAPTVATEIPDQTATTGTAFNYAFPDTTFTDADSDTLTYTATLADDTGLPAWLSFTAATRTFSGTPTAAGTVSVKVTASDASDSVSDTFDIVVSLPPDTSPTLVSNAGQGDDHNWTTTEDRSQTFTTSVGATLSSVEIISEDLDGGDVAVSLCTVDGSDHPTSTCTVLTAPPSFAAGTLVFRAPANTTLAANTTYSLLIASPVGEWLLLDATDSDNEDAGGATGWSIANTFDVEDSPNTWVARALALRITIKGTINNAPTVATEIPDQTAMSGTAFSYQVPAATFTDADSDTLTYTATLADDTALPAWLSFAPATRTFSGTPQAADVETVSVKVTASDGNGGSVSDTFDIVVDLPADTTAPRVASIVRETPTSSPTNADSLTWRVTFSEAVSNVDAADFVVSGTTATVTAVAAVSGVTGAYDVTASGGNLAGVSATVGLAIASSHNIQDGASNALSNTAPTGTNDNSYVVDNTAPTVTISDVPATSDAPFTATFTFPEAVTGFVVGDITLGNATASSFTVTSTTVYTALVTPTAAGAVTVDVPANAAQDAAGNGNTAATRASSTYAPPAITIVAGTSPVTEGTSAVFTLSRAGSTTAALTVNVTVSETGGDMVAASNEGDQTVTFLANAATATLSVTTASDSVDEANSVVTATISADTGSPVSYSVGTPSSAMVTVEDNDTRDVKVSATALTVNEGTTGTYTVVLGSQPTASVTVTPSRTGSSDVTFSPATLTFTTSTWNTVQEVTVTVAQDSDAVNDSATISHAVTGGDYAGVTVESVVVTVDDDETADTTAPRVASIVREAPTSSPTNADSLTWRVTFSETVLNVDAADFAVSGTTATVTAVAAVSGVTGAYDVTASGGNLAALNATVTLAIAASHNIEDGASNSLTNTTPTGTNNNSYVVDNTAPSVTISGVPASSDAPFRATFTFSEAVTGFAVGDITLGNATASSFTSTSTTVYRALVTPTAAGAVTVDVPANAAQDAAGNGNTAATRASSTYAGTVIPAAMLPTVTLRTQSVPESIGTAMLVVTLDQPASAPLSVPWYTLSGTAMSPGDYTNGEGTLIIPSGVTNATISITIIDDAVEEPTETVLVLLSPGDGYELGGSGATVSILDDDGDGPAPSGATVDGATVVLTYNEPLAGASTPSSTAFVLRVAGDPVSINEVSVDGSEVTLTLAAPVPAGQTVSLDYTQPVSNPIQDASGNKAQSFTRWYLVTDSTITGAITVPGVPTDLSASTGGETRINLSWTAPGDDGGSSIIGYRIEVSPDGNANWTELVANTGNTDTTYAHIGLAAGTTRHYRVSAINSAGAGDPSNIDDAIASIPSLSLRTQTVLESIGTAVLAVTLDQPAGDPLSVPWYTLNGDAVSPGDYTAGGGQLIIPSGATSATISITIIDDADEEATETVLVLLSPGEGYVLGGSGATVSILDDDGDGPAPIRATVNSTTVVLTYNKPLDGASTPSSTAFHLRMADNRASVDEVSVNGSEVTLTLASPVQAGQTVSLDYTQPMSNPIQDGSGNKAQSFIRWYLVTGSTITGTVDNTAPRVASIVRETPTSSPTNADSLTWRVTFSEAVSNVDAADFVVSGTTATVTAVAAVSGVTGAYDVTASGGNLAGVSATVGLAIAASHNIQDGASNSLTNTTPTGTNNNSYVVDNTAPSVTISGVPASSDAPFRATFTFSEAVTGFAVGDIRLDNASGSSFTVTSTTVYRALVTPTAAGTVTVDVSANAARDAAGNGNTAATQASSTYSGTVIPAAMLPTVTLRTQSVPESIGTAMLVVTLDQPASAPLSVPWYTLSSTAASPGDYTNGAGTLIIPSGVTNATISITIIDDAVEEPTETVLVLLSPGDGYELGGSGATVSILDDDGDGPAPSGATVDGATVVLTYNEPLDGASTPSSTAFVLRVAGDPVSINEVSVDGSEVTLTLAAPVPAGQTVSLDYTAPMSNPIQDASGNKAQSFTRWYLVTESTITITNPVITVPGAPTALSATAVGNTQINLSWTAPGENGGAPISGYKIESSPDGVANWTELVANTGNANTTYEHLGLTVGTTRHYRVSAINSVGVGRPSNIDDAIASIPTVTLRTQSVPESIGTAMLVVTLDQPAGNPLSVPWYTRSGTAMSPGDYTNGEGTLIIPSGVTNATISITIIDDAVEEPTETFLVLLSPGEGYVLGGSGATVSILDDDGAGPAPIRATVNGTTVVLTYNKPLDGDSTPSSTAFHLRVADNRASVDEVSVNGSEVTLTLASPVQAGQTVSLDYTQPMSNPIQDGSGHKAQSFTRWYLVTDSTITGTVDTTAPRVASIVRETPTSSPTNADSLTWRVTFSEAVSNVDAADFVVSGTTATVTAVAAVSGVTGAYDVTASGGNLAGVSATVGLAIASSHNIQDGASNALSNTAPTGTNDNSYVVDNTAPTVTISDVPATSDAPFTATFTFPEAVTGFVVGDITLGNATASSFTVTSTTVYTALVTPTAAGAVTVDVPANAAQDAAGNGNTAATRASSTYTGSATRGVTVSATVLTVTEGSTGAYTVVLDSQPTANVTVTPSRTGSSDVTFSPATLTFTALNWNTVQPVTVTAAQDGDAVDDSATISHAVTGGDYAGVTVESVVVTVDDDETADTTGPRVASIVRQNPTVSPTNADSLTWRVTFSEAVSNVDAADFAVSGTTATVTAVAVSGLTGAYDVSASGGNLAALNATVTLAIAASHNIQDGASNSLTNTTPTGTNNNSYVVDNTAPSVTISGVPASSDAPFTATFTFPEAVTGFAVGDITLGNATASSFTVTSTTVYTALITPAVSGTVTVDVPANAAQDAAGNGNTAAARATSTYTGTAALPAITIAAGASPVTEGTSAVFTLSRTGSTTDALTVNVTVSEAGGDMVAASNEGARTVTFLANSTTVTLSIATASDSVAEANSVVTATISADTGSPASYSVGAPGSAMVTVRDDDSNITVPGVPTDLSSTGGDTRINLSWTAPGDDGGSPIIGYKIEVSPDGNANWTELVATGNTTTTYAHIGLAVGTTRHYRVSAINSAGAGDPSNIDDATVIITTVTLRTQSIPEGIGTAAVLVTLNQPAGDPLSVPWYTLNGDAVSPGDYTAGAGQLIIPSGATSATISITIIDDADAEPTETVLVLLSPGEGYVLGGSGATLSILDDDGAGPAPIRATVNGTTVVLTYNKRLDGASTPSSTAFHLRMADNRASVDEVSVNGSEVTLTLASPVQAGQTVSLDYTQPMSNPIQDGSGNKAQSFTRWYLVTGSTITDDETTVPGVPTDLSASTGGDTRINLSWTAPGDDGGSPIIGYKIEVSPDGNANWTELVANTGNTTTTYAHIGLAAGTTRHYRVSAINSAGAGDPSNIDDATTRPITGPITGGGGGGGGGGPSPSKLDFEWTVTRDIEALDSGHDSPSGMWSDGSTLWLAENGDGADDSVYAYDLATGERVESREFALADTNRAPRGIWSDGETVWVSDSGRERLFAYRLADGERVEEREFALAEGNSDARGIWSDEETMWVLDSRADALFVYDFESGELLGEYELDAANGDPHGVWSDGVTVWVSDHGAKRLFAYRLPAPEAPAAEDVEPQDLERVRDEEFKELSKASNNSPRGLWSDGDVMYVADESDAKVYSYNMPNAIDARLASLTLSSVDIGEFSPGTTGYEGAADEGVTQTTVEAQAAQRRATIAIDPPDADESAEGHQVALEGVSAITVTVTSADGSRERVYRVRFAAVDHQAPGDPTSRCFRGDVVEGFSLVIYEGGNLEDLVICAVSRHVVALYVLDNGIYMPYIVGAPDFVNRSFQELYPDGVPPVTPLIAGSDGPPSADPFAAGVAEDERVTLRGSSCLHGEITTGFSFVVFGGGSTAELEACAQRHAVTAVYALVEGEYVSYILGAPDFVNQAFAELFADGVPAVTPLVAKSDSPLTASGDTGDAAEN